MNNSFLHITELIFIFIVGVTTILFNPPLPLLAIPFLLILTARTIFNILDKEEKTNDRHKKII